MTSSQCKVYGLRGVKPTMWKKTKKTENFLGRVGWVIFLRDPILIIHGQHALLYYKWQKQPPSSETQILLDSSGYEWPGLKFGTFCALFLQCWLATWTTTSKQMMYFTTYIRKQARGVPRVLSCNIEQTGATLTSIILRYWSTTHWLLWITQKKKQQQLCTHSCKSTHRQSACTQEPTQTLFVWALLLPALSPYAWLPKGLLGNCESWL